MKAVKIVNTTTEFKVWCDACNIRVAPNETKTVIHGKTYHPLCYAKIDVKPSPAGTV